MTLSSSDQAQRWLSLRLRLNQHQSQLEDNMKARTVLTGSGVIMAIMLLAGPIGTQAAPQLLNNQARLTLNEPASNLTTVISVTTQLTETQPLPLVPHGCGDPSPAPYPLWGHRLTTNGVNDYAPRAAFNPRRNEYLIVWAECPEDNLCNVVGRRTTSQGTPIGDPFTISSGHKDMLPTIGYNSYHGEYLVTYGRYSTTESDLYGRVILGSGTLWGSELTIDAGPGYQALANIAFNPTAINHGHPGEYLVAYESGGMIVTKHVGSYGDVDTLSRTVDDYGNFTTPDVTYNPARNEYLVTYADIITNTPTLHDWDIYARRLSADGAPTGYRLYIAVGTLDATSPQVAVGDDTYFIVHTLGPNNVTGTQQIVGSWLAGEGNPIAYSPPLLIVPPPDGLEFPRVAYVDQGFLVTWGSATGTGTANVYGQYVRPGSGFVSEKFALNDGLYDQFNGDVACATGSCLAVANDNCDDDHDFEIYAWNLWLQQVFLPLVLK
jgi:hypothetical protein